MIGGPNAAGWSSSTPTSTWGRSSRYSITLRPLRPDPSHRMPACTWSSRVFHSRGNSPHVVAAGITAVGRLGTVTIEIVVDSLLLMSSSPGENLGQQRAVRGGCDPGKDVRNPRGPADEHP